jgi:hypothetical protein
MAGPNLNDTPTRGDRLTRADIDHIVGEITDTQATALLALGLTQAELEQAAMWASGQSDVMARERRPPVGRVAAACEILAPEFEPDDGLD